MSGDSPAARAKAVLAAGVARHMFSDSHGTPGRHPFDNEVADELLADLAAASLSIVSAEDKERMQNALCLEAEGQASHVTMAKALNAIKNVAGRNMAKAVENQQVVLETVLWGIQECARRALEEAEAETEVAECNVRCNACSRSLVGVSACDSQCNRADCGLRPLLRLHTAERERDGARIALERTWAAECGEQRKRAEAADLSCRSRLAEADARAKVLEACENVVQQLVKAVDDKQLEMNSPEIGEPEVGIPTHPWHEELLYYARKAIAPAADKGETGATHAGMAPGSDALSTQMRRAENGE